MNRIGRAIALPIATAAGLAALVFAGAPSVAVQPQGTDAVAATRDLALEGEAIHGAIASTVAETLLVDHYDAHPINDELSREWLESYIDRLDYRRFYFLQSDIEEFSRWSTTLDDDILSPKPKLEPAWAIHKRYLERVDERIARALEMIDKDYTFDDPALVFESNTHELPWLTTSDELDERWRTRVMEELLQMKLAETPTKDSPAVRLRRRYERIRKETHDLYAEDVLEIYLGALTHIFDPHSVWFKPIAKENFDIDMRDTLTGIGAQLKSEEGYTVITKLIPGGPAEASEELQPNDTILAVGQGKDGEPVDIVDMRIDRVVQLIRGTKGTVAHLLVHPADASDPSEVRDIYITRDVVKLSHAAASGTVREMDAGDEKVKVGIIDVPSFYVDSEGQRMGRLDYGSTARDMAKIIRGFKGDGVNALVVDLRQNGGGSLDQAILTTGLFLPTGPVVQIRNGAGVVEALDDKDPSVLWNGPLVVLTSELSASASEIFAGAIQDYGRGIVVGAKTTHGKGTVQNMIGLRRHLSRIGYAPQADQGGALKFTTHMFYRVNGDSTQINGVAADIVLPSRFEGLDYKEADLDNPLPWDQIAAARYKARPLGIDLDAMRKASDARIRDHREFSYLRADIARRAKLQAETGISLDLATRRAEIDEVKAEQDDREAQRKAAGWDGESPLDPILDEAVEIARDYVGQLGG